MLKKSSLERDDNHPAPTHLHPVPPLMENEILKHSPNLQNARSPLWAGLTDRDTGMGRVLQQLQNHSSTGASTTGGDFNIDQSLAQVSGEEAVGGTAPTPEQNVVEDLAVAVGIEIPDREWLHTTEMLENRDSHRWELDPKSSEDYSDRRDW
ncbi:DUF6335 family protein [Alkalinema pantanalense CENA528]|uniref:DUF6335 family protein n=1 Tax=Alkalinema pantanalense TaxID=1620705 RepID=UPI003D6F0590